MNKYKPSRDLKGRYSNKNESSKSVFITLLVTVSLCLIFQAFSTDEFISPASSIEVEARTGGSGPSTQRIDITPTPSPTIIPPTPTPTQSQEQLIEQEIRLVFGKAGDTAVKVARCESGLNPQAKNKISSARGLFQIMQSWHKIDQKWLFNPNINILVAKQLYDEQGWNPWEASRWCWGGK